MIDPTEEQRRIAQAQAAATEKAKADMADPDATWMAVMAVAPFELAEVFAEWVRQAERDVLARGWRYPEICTVGGLALCNGLGPPWPCGVESPQEFGRRMAAGIVKLLKEV